LIWGITACARVVDDAAPAHDGRGTHVLENKGGLVKAANG
jgi:hypothetical protein